ncbi:hypothetical protein [Bradyrhizobium septentrionale]|uniref:hypothetical protein n=1 Tax=Bradyrhizobium septentrionale TaxID=1404411 RepID=UPI0030D0A16C
MNSGGIATFVAARMRRTANPNARHPAIFQSAHMIPADPGRIFKAAYSLIAGCIDQVVLKGQVST